MCSKYGIETEGKTPRELWQEIHEAEERKKRETAERMGVVNEDEANEEYLEILRDTYIGRSLGAKALNYDVFYEGRYVHFVEGTHITNKEIIAGRGSHVRIRVEDYLIAEYGGKRGFWCKMKGRGWLDIDGSNEYAEVHWYEEPSVGKFDFKVKKLWNDKTR